MSTEQNKAVLLRAAENFSRQGDKTAYLELYDTEAILHGYAGVEPGLVSITQFYQGFWVAFPDCQLTLDNLVAEGDKVACSFVVRGTHQGDFMGIPPIGKPINLTGATILRFANGKCVERWSQADFLGLLQQLGVAPSPGQG